MKTNFTLHLSVCITVTVLSSLLLGCGKASEKATEKMMEKAIGDGAKVDIQGDKMTVKTSEGEFVVAGSGSASIPEGFPKDVHVFQGATITSSMKMADGMQVVLQSREPMAKVRATYVETMKAQDWTEESVMDAGDTVMLSYTKDKRSAVVVLLKDPKGTVIQVSTKLD